MVQNSVKQKFDDIAGSDARLVAMTESSHGDDAQNTALEIQMMRCMREKNPTAKLAYFLEQPPVTTDIKWQPLNLQEQITKFMSTGLEEDMPPIKSPHEREKLHEARKLGFTVICIDDEVSRSATNDALKKMLNFQKENLANLRSSDPAVRLAAIKMDTKNEMEYVNAVDATLNARNQVMGSRLANIMPGTNTEVFYKGIIPAGGFDKALTDGGSRHWYNGNDVNEIAEKGGVGKIAKVELAYMGNSPDVMIEKPAAYFEQKASADKPDLTVNIMKATDLPAPDAGNKSR